MRYLRRITHPERYIPGIPTLRGIYRDTPPGRIKERFTTLGGLKRGLPTLGGMLGVL